MSCYTFLNGRLFVSFLINQLNYKTCIKKHFRTYKWNEIMISQSENSHPKRSQEKKEMVKSCHWNWAHTLKLNTWVFHHQIYIFMILRNMLKKISPILVRHLHREPLSLTYHCWKVWPQYLKSYHFPWVKKVLQVIIEKWE